MIKCLVQRFTSIGHDIARYSHPSFYQNANPLPGMGRIGVGCANDNPSNSILNDRVGAGRRTAVSATRFQGHVQVSAPGILFFASGIKERLDFTVRLSRAIMPAPPLTIS